MRTMGTSSFPPTRWSLIIATRERPTTEARRALAGLCGSYWYPLYAYARRVGHNAADAEDLTQGFFARLIEKHYLEDYDRERGRFRSFLLTSFRHYIANERDRALTQKRGGGRVVALDLEDAERRYRLEPADPITPERLYERRWAMLLIERAMEKLEAEADRPSHFQRLRSFLTGEPAKTSYRQLAEQMGVSEGAAKMAVHRLRGKFRNLLQAQVAETVAGPEEIKEELRYLLSVLA
jgi:RNA polymerase sigma factor (sigma-70 family)